MTSIGTRLFTWLHGELVGKDEQGNKYYVEKGKPARGTPRRWVVFNGAAEASRVPPEWHAWLHRMAADPPSGERPRQPWQKEHLPNLTGTPAAYRPAGHDFRGGRRAAATGDYQPWTPD